MEIDCITANPQDFEFKLHPLKDTTKTEEDEEINATFVLILHIKLE